MVRSILVTCEQKKMTMKRSRSLYGCLLWICSIELVFACKATEHDDSNTKSHSTKPSNSELSPIGIAECDEYVRQVTKCISRAPGDQKKTLTKNLERAHATWTSLAANQGTRSSVGQSCEVALRTTKGAMQALSCEW